eukprot:545909-Ditylum_brightwellii.AAC.1
MDTSSGNEDDGNEDDELAGDDAEFKKITDINEKNKAWWVTFMMTNGEIVNESLKNVERMRWNLGSNNNYMTLLTNTTLT